MRIKACGFRILERKVIKMDDMNRERIFGKRTVHRINPQTGQDEYYYLDPRGARTFAEMKEIPVPSEDSPNPFANEIQNYLYEHDDYNYKQLYGNTPPPVQTTPAVQQPTNNTANATLGQPSSYFQNNNNTFGWSSNINSFSGNTNNVFSSNINFGANSSYGTTPAPQNQTSTPWNNDIQINSYILSDNQRQLANSQALKYANLIKQKAYKNIDNEIIKADNSLTSNQKMIRLFWNNLQTLNPAYRIGETFGTLESARQEMNSVNKDGYDNYAHRYGMYTNAQDGIDKAVYTLAAGGLKELKDVHDKIITNKQFWTESNKIKKINATLSDSWKDIQNNFEAVKAGLQNPNIDGRLWLEDFDYKSNKWRK